MDLTSPAAESGMEETYKHIYEKRSRNIKNDFPINLCHVMTFQYKSSESFFIYLYTLKCLLLMQQLF